MHTSRKEFSFRIVYVSALVPNIYMLERDSRNIGKKQRYEKKTYKQGKRNILDFVNISVSFIFTVIQLL